MKLKKTLAGVGAGATLLTAFAVAPAVAQDEAPDTTDDGATEAPGRHRRGHHLADVAELLGVTAEDLRDRIQGGETLADIAAAEGVAVEDVVATLFANAQERIAGAVENERLAQDEADEKLVDIEERITDFVNGEGELPGRRGPRGFRLGAEVTELLGIDGPELMEQLRDGATLADIAAEQGVSVDELSDAMTAPLVERLEQAVADGNLTQEEADEKLAELSDRIDGAISGEIQFGEGGFGRGGHRGFGPGGQDGAPEDAAETFNA